jgi:hypothetical protein
MVTCFAATALGSQFINALKPANSGLQHYFMVLLVALDKKMWPFDKGSLILGKKTIYLNGLDTGWNMKNREIGI